MSRLCTHDAPNVAPLGRKVDSAVSSNSKSVEKAQVLNISNDS